MKKGDNGQEKTNKTNRSVKIAEKGLKRGIGRMDELRSFMMERAEESKDRTGYLKLRFAQTIDCLTLKSYKAFKKICSKKEWGEYEPGMLKALEEGRGIERIKIHLCRNEYDIAIKFLTRSRYPDTRYGGSEILKIAVKLEKRYPEAILSFYQSGLGNLNTSSTRQTYAEQAKVMVKVRHMWVNVMRVPEKWEAYGRKVKDANLKRPAFQQEFARVIPGWKDL